MAQYDNSRNVLFSFMLTEPAEQYLNAVLMQNLEQKLYTVY